MLVGRGRRVARLLAPASVLVAVLGGCGGTSTETPSDAPSTVDPDAYATELLDLTNVTRVEQGLEELVRSPCARAAALERAAALVGEEELVHAPLAPVIDACAPLTTAAENLVNSSAEPIDVVDAWLRSPGHRANIVDPKLTEIGISCVRDDEMMLCSQVFLGP